MTKNFDAEMEQRAREAVSGVQVGAPSRDDVPLSLHRVLAAMFRGRWLVFLMTLVGFLVGALLAVITPNSWLSVGKFMFTGIGSENVAVSQTGTTERSGESINQAAAYLFTSHDLLARVVDKVTPEKVLKPYEPGAQSSSWLARMLHNLQREYSRSASGVPAREAALLRLQDTIEVERPQHTPVLVVRCLANGPALAQEILQVYMHEAVQWHLEKYDDPKMYEEVQKRAETAEKGLAEAQKAMRMFLEKNQIRDFVLERTEAQTSYLAAGRQLAEKRELLQVTTGVRKEWEAKLRDIPRDRTVTTRQSADSAIQLFKTQIATAQIELSRATIENKPEEVVTRWKKQIENLNELMEKASKEAAEGKELQVVVPNPDWEIINTNYLQQSLEETKLKAEVASREESYQKGATRVEQIDALSPTYAGLQDDLRRAEEERKRAGDALDAANRRRQLKLGSFSSLQEVESASLPLEKEGPNRGKLILGGLFAGLFLGIGIVLLRTVADATIRERDDLERLDGIAVIGVMPRLDGRNLRRHRSLREQGW